MKIAIIYYSYDGNCAMAANLLKDAAGADLFELKPVKEKKRTGFAKYFWGGGQVIFKRRPALKPLEADISSYDLIVLGTPVWAGFPSPAMLSFLAQKRITGKKIALFCSYDGSSGKTFERLKALLPGNTMVGEMGLKSPARAGSEAVKIQIEKWAKEIKA